MSATKWVVDLEVTRFDRAAGLLDAARLVAHGRRSRRSRGSTCPADGAGVRAGPVAVAGIAWAQHRGISGVEVRVDDGAWQAARLGAEATVDTWRQWVFAWDAAPGKHVLQVRAIDRSGAAQTGTEAPPAPDGATGWHTVDGDRELTFPARGG